MLQKKKLHDPIRPYPTYIIQGHCKLFDRIHSISEVWAKLDQRERRYAQDKRSQTDRMMDERTEGSTDWSL